MNVVSRLSEGVVLRGRVVGIVLVTMLALTTILTISSTGIRLVSLLGRDAFGLPYRLPIGLLAVGYVLLAGMGYYRVRVFARPICTAGALVGSLGCVPLLYGAARVGNGLLCVLGMALFIAVFVWITFLFACCLVRLPSLRAAAVVTVVGTVLWQCALFVLRPIEGQSIEMVLLGMACTGVVGVLSYVARDPVRKLATREPLAGIELTNPLASLHVSPRLYGCVFLVSMTYYFSNSLGVPGMTARRMAVIVVLLVLLYLLLIQREGQEDRLFSLVVLCIITGLLMAPLVLDRDAFIAHTCMFIGARCFDILLWLVVYGLGVRNITVMVPFFGVAYGLNALGRMVGGALGATAMAMVDSNVLTTQAVILGLALFFFAFIWLGFREFSFTRAIRGVDTIETLEPLDAHEHIGADGLEGRCRMLAEQAFLTPRETQILELLARGRNAQFIMDTLTITRNTAKAHIRHVYTKLGVHSQQELLTLVESGRDGASLEGTLR